MMTMSPPRTPRRRHSSLRLPIPIKKTTTFADLLETDESATGESLRYRRFGRDCGVPTTAARAAVALVDAVVAAIEVERCLAASYQTGGSLFVAAAVLLRIASSLCLAALLYHRLPWEHHLGHSALFTSHVVSYLLFRQSFDTQAVLCLAIRSAAYVVILPTSRLGVAVSACTCWIVDGAVRVIPHSSQLGREGASVAVHVPMIMMVLLGAAKGVRERYLARLTEAPEGTVTPRPAFGPRSATSPPSSGGRSSIETLKDLLACAHLRIQGCLDGSGSSTRSADIRTAKRLLERSLQLITSTGNLYAFQLPDHDTVSGRRMSEFLYGFDPVSYRGVPLRRGGASTTSSPSLCTDSKFPRRVGTSAPPEPSVEDLTRVDSVETPEFKTFSRATTFAQSTRLSKRISKVMASTVENSSDEDDAPICGEATTADTSPARSDAAPPRCRGKSERTPLRRDLIDVRWLLIGDHCPQTVYPENTEDLMSVVGCNWEKSFFQIASECGDHALLESGYVLLERHRNRCSLRCSEAQLLRFLSMIESLYQNNHYHNRTHGAFVGHALHFLSQRVFNCEIGPLDQSVMAVSALCHDVGHLGLNNAFYVKSESPIAVVYNDQSVLENYHSSMTFAVLRRPECAIFSGAPADEFREVRQSIIELILATDLKYNADLCAKLRVRRESPDFDPAKNVGDKWMCAKLCIAAADVAHVALPWEEHVQWAARIEEELYLQGDEEQKLSLQISPLCDRSKASEFPSAQKGFLAFIALPTFELLGEMDVSETLRKTCVSQIESNIESWEREGQDGEQSTDNTG
eukprot:Polyplicarium_translucidae@DN2534_c0_g1_i1.p1